MTKACANKLLDRSLHKQSQPSCLTFVLRDIFYVGRAREARAKQVYHVKLWSAQGHYRVTKPILCFYKKLYNSHKIQQMNKISGKELNLLKTLEILKSNRFVSFYHFNNLSKRRWDTIKQKLRKIETQDIPVKKSFTEKKEKSKKTIFLPLNNLLLDRTEAMNWYVAGNSMLTNNKGITTKRDLKRAEIELLVLKSKAVVKNLYSLLPEKNLPYPPVSRINSIINAFCLIDGPTLLVGAYTVEGFKECARQLEKEKSLVFVGGVLENQFINHLDLKDCLKTFLPTSANLLQTLNYPLTIPPLYYISNKLLFLLQERQESLKKDSPRFSFLCKVQTS